MLIFLRNEPWVFAMNLQPQARSPGDAVILLVEDEPDIADLVVEVLAADGYTVRVATTLDEARTALREATFDLVLADGPSPHPEAAFAAAREILGTAGSTPVVLFTTHRREPDEVRATGFADLITKPFNVDDFTQRVRTLLPA